MQEYIPWYINEYLDTNVPWWMIAAIMAVAVMASGFRWVHRVSRGGRKSGSISAIWLIAYMTYLLCDTVIFRTSAPEAHHIFTPFWNYYDVFINGNLEDLGEIIMNIAVFLPVGVLAAAGSLELKNKNHKNPSAGCEAIASGANACPSESSSKLGTSAEQSSSPSTFGGSQPTEEKNQRFAKNLSSYGVESESADTQATVFERTDSCHCAPSFPNTVFEPEAMVFCSTDVANSKSGDKLDSSHLRACSQGDNVKVSTKDDSPATSGEGFYGFCLNSADVERHGKCHWFWKVVALGFCFSLTIELLQLVLHRGLCETDDVIHNTVGCAIGAGVVWLIEKLRKLEI